MASILPESRVGLEWFSGLFAVVFHKVVVACNETWVVALAAQSHATASPKPAPCRKLAARALVLQVESLNGQDLAEAKVIWACLTVE